MLPSKYIILKNIIYLEGSILIMDYSILLFIAVGFIAQMIDGALGMAYGVSSTTFLLSMGVPAAMASASVHMAEAFTTFVSGIFHFKLGNFDKKLFKTLVIPGILGGIIGAYILTSVPSDTIKPIISIYLLIMGIRILFKAIKKIQEEKLMKKNGLMVLGFIGGFFDAIGGGGWGPIVTTTLVAKGYAPRFSIGSVNIAEFFVTIAQVITFMTFIQFIDWQVIVGLIIGGIIAAPFAAQLCKNVSARTLMIIVGCLIIGLSIRTIYLSF